jgi:hypothetical protein
VGLGAERVAALAGERALLGHLSVIDWSPTG